MLSRLIAPLCAVSFVSSAVFGGAIQTPALAATSLTGAGSTFDQPFFDAAFPKYGHGVSINYQAVGSGAGIAQFIAKTVDFGASDVPMNPTTDLKSAVAAGGPVVQVPVVLGGVSIAYHVQGIKSGLHLSPAVLSRIYLGLITKWNNAAIKKLNPKVKLPDEAIVPVHRADGSGTSYIFTDYLGKVSDQWRGLVGTSKTPSWPANVGAAGTGNPGVAQVVQQTEGAIGYVELAFVLQNHMKQAALENYRKQFVTPTPRSIAAAADSFKKISATNFSIVNSKAKNAYAICGYSWALMFQHYSDPGKAKALSNLFKWVVSSGQKFAKGLDYVSLPKNVESLALGLVKKVK